MFVDGGVTPHNNPAFKLFLLTTLKPYGFNWATGSEKLSVTSIGTGSLAGTVPANRLLKLPSAMQAKEALTSMIDETERMNELLMQLVSDPSDPRWIDSELKYLKGVHLSDEAQCAYQRYQTTLDSEVLRTELGIGLTP